MSKNGDSCPDQFPQKMADSAPLDSPTQASRAPVPCFLLVAECDLRSERSNFFLPPTSFVLCTGECCPEMRPSAVPLSLNACLLLPQLLPWTQQCVSPPRGRLESSSRVSFQVKFACLPWTLLEDESCGSVRRKWGRGTGAFGRVWVCGAVVCAWSVQREGVLTLVHALPVFISGWIPVV